MNHLPVLVMQFIGLYLARVDLKSRKPGILPHLPLFISSLPILLFLILNFKRLIDIP